MYLCLSTIPWLLQYAGLALLQTESHHKLSRSGDRPQHFENLHVHVVQTNLFCFCFLVIVSVKKQNDSYIAFQDIETIPLQK